MADLIDRKEAIRAFDDAGFCTHGYIVDVLEELPSAQPAAGDDLVSRKAVKKWLERWAGYIDMDIIRRMQYRVIDIPSTQTDRKKGRWLDSQGKEKYVGYCAECSACGGWSEYITDFCPNCGARMDRGESE